MPEIGRSAAPTAAKPQSGMIAELSWKVRPWMAVLESHARNQPERSTDRGEAAIRDDCRASVEVQAMDGGSGVSCPKTAGAKDLPPQSRNQERLQHLGESQTRVGQ